MTDYKKAYNAEYYSEYGHTGTHYLATPAIRLTLSGLAGFLKSQVKPKSHLDVGCAFGLLVANMRRLGVESYGVDVSEYAIFSAVQEARRYVAVSDITTDVHPRRYDVVSCVEVVEHLPPELEDVFLDALCSLSDTIYFSSENNADEETHLNPHPLSYWMAKFADRMYLPDSKVYGLIPWGRLFRKATKPADKAKLLDKETRSDVLIRDNFQCVLCEQKGVQVHEIVPRSYFGTRDMWMCFAEKNRICLCPTCHSEAHTVSGRRAAVAKMQELYGYQYDEQIYQKYVTGESNDE